MNNKGFAITGILYTLFILFLLILVSVLAGLHSKKNMLEKMTNIVEKSFQGSTLQSDSNVQLALEKKVAPINGKYVFELNTLQNLIYGVVDTPSTKTEGITYQISNKKITVRADKNDGYGFVGAKVYLNANTNYIFSCDTNGIWDASESSNTVEAFLMLNGKYSTIKHMTSNDNFNFQVPVTGEYWLRLDVNMQGKTYEFSNIKITDNITQTTCSTYLNKGTPFTKEAITFIPKDCNDYDYTFSQLDDNSNSVSKMTLKKIYSFEGDGA